MQAPRVLQGSAPTVQAMKSSQPFFGGSALARPGADLDEQGLAFDVATVISRRRALHLLGAGTAGVALSACGSTGVGTSNAAAHTSSTTSTTGGTSKSEIPDETAGPYPGDGSNGPDVLDQSGIVRRDIRSSFGDATGTAGGVPMTIELTINDLAHDGRSFAGVAVYVWHCDRQGRYSLYSEGITDQNYLRGVQVADESGKVHFTSIFPACYSGRWPHIHFEVYPNVKGITDATNAIATSQVALPKETCDAVYATTGYEQSVTNLAQVSLATDNVFSDDGGKSQLATVTGNVTDGFVVSLEVGVDTHTKPTGGSAPGGGGPGGGPPGGGDPSEVLPGRAPSKSS